MAFDAYQLPPEHVAVRDAVRAICADKVAPNAANADETGEFPWASYEALRAGDFHAPHIPVEYGGAGADALATAIIIEEVARVCATSSLIPAVNKLGTMPLILAGSEELKQRYLSPVARGEAMFSYGLSEREAGSDTAATTRPASPGSTTTLVPNGPTSGSRPGPRAASMLACTWRPGRPSSNGSTRNSMRTGAMADCLLDGPRATGRSACLTMCKGRSILGGWPSPACPP